MSRYIVIVLLIWSSAPLAGQYDAADLRQWQEQYGDHSSVILKETDVLDIKMKAGRPIAILSSVRQLLLLRASSESLHRQYTYSSDFKELIEFRAAHYSLSGNKYKRKEIHNMESQVSIDGAIFYDNIQEHYATYPRTAVGDILEITTIHEIDDPEFMPMFMLQRPIPIAYQEVSITWDADVDMDIKRFHLTDTYTIEESSSKSQKRFHLSASDIAASPREFKAPNSRYYSPHLVAVLQSYIHRGSEHEVLSNTDALYAWYYGFIRSIYETDHSEYFASIVEDIIDGKSTDRERMMAIYEWVQEQIKYIAFEDGMGGFVPRDPQEVYRKRYGDCKDKSALIYALGKAANLDVAMCWIGSRDIPYSYEQLPAPYVDNHMIACYRDDQGYHFLDGTGQYLPLGAPTEFIQGKEALIAIDHQEYELVDVPSQSPEDNRTVDTVRMELSGEMVKGTGTVSLRGYPRINMVRNLSSYADEKDKAQKRIEALTRKGNNAYVLTDYKVTQASKYEDQWDCTYTFSLGGYAQEVNKDLYLNMNMSPQLTSHTIDTDRKLPIEHEYMWDKNYVVQLTVPAGRVISHLPDPSSYDGGAFGYESKYTQQDNIVTYHHRVYLNTLMVQPSDMGQWHDFLRSLRKTYKQSIVVNDKS